MIKRVIVGLDGAPNGRTALEVAASIAGRSDGEVVGLAILDQPGIAKSMAAAPAGGYYYAKEAVEAKLAEVTETLEGFLADFEQVCLGLGVKHESCLVKGDPFEQIPEKAKTADLIVVGLESHFHFATRSSVADTLERLLENKVCPILAVPEKPVSLAKVLIAYDGSGASSKAMRFFTCLADTLPPVENLQLLHVTEDALGAQKEMTEVSRYLSLYGLSAEVNICPGEPSKRIYEEALKIMPGLVVVGAYGRSGLRKIFWGSTTRRIINDGTIPMLLYH